MSKPLPIIYAPAGPARDKVIDAIYAAGWSMNGGQRDAVTLPRTNAYDLYDHIHLSIVRWFSYTIGSNRDFTLVNSPAHLIAYCRTLGIYAPKSLIINPLPAPLDHPF